MSHVKKEERVMAAMQAVFTPPLAKGVGGFAERIKSPCIPLFKRGKVIRMKGAPCSP